jgi:DNA polymerase delta subunit 1
LDASGQPITELYTNNITGLHLHDFIHIEITGFTSDYYKDGQKFPIIDIQNRQMEETVYGKLQIVNYTILCISGHEYIDMTKSIKWNVAKDDVSPQDIFRLTNGTSADRAIVAKYCIQDCNLVHHLMNKIDVLTGYVEMSKICSVPISFLVFRGQGIKLTSYVAKKCREKNTLMPDLEKNYQDHDGYEGAIVLPPKCSMYMDNPVACVDYASLYPSSMISQNYSHDSKVSTIEYNLSGKVIKETGEKSGGKYIYDNLPEYQYVDIEFDTFKYLRNPDRPAAKAVKTKVGKKICRWAQLPNGQKSIMPAILEELLRARADTRKMIKTEKDPFMQNILDKRQLGYKVTANSLYGQCGAKTSTFYEQDVAASTTATGRMMITYAKRIIEEVYGDLEYDTQCIGPVQTKAEYVYGDTDSVFFTFNLQDPATGAPIRGAKALEATIEIAQDAANLCTQWLKPPMELTYEKTLMPFILLSKKRYVGMLYETNPKKGKMKYMGLSLKRRDSCDYLKDTYGGILNILMKENNIQKAMTFLEQSLGELTAGSVPMDKLTITKALRGYYKNPAQIAHAVLAERIAKRDPGNKPKPGDRMKFVHIVSADKKALQGEKIETTDFILQERLALDYTFYITNQLMKPLQQLFGLALEQIWSFQNKVSAIKTYKTEMEEMEKEWGRDLEVFMKKKEKYCSAKVKVLLFDKVLTKINNDKQRIQPITSFFGSVLKK